jgi:hypothetical protein
MSLHVVVHAELRSVSVAAFVRLSFSPNLLYEICHADFCFLFRKFAPRVCCVPCPNVGSQTSGLSVYREQRKEHKLGFRGSNTKRQI